ncbi:MAG TPA: chemotaxis protein CheX [Spirochaetes bacterium]|nr:chemotaxis protein CheX [Spirochaetota bacterium]
MRLEYINPFVEASCDILEEVLDVKIEKEELFLKETTVPILGVAVLIGLTGNVRGRVLIDMEQDTALKIAGIMNMEEIAVFDEMAKATITELANMIGGRAITELHNEGFDFEVSPPTIFTGTDMEVSSPHLEAFIVPLDTPFGRIEVNVAVKEREDSNF